MKQAALYGRVSTSEQKEEGTSLDTQRDLGLVKASELGWSVSEEHIILEDWTGTDLLRPGLLRLLDLARSGRIKGIIIYTLDRLYRPENEGDEWRVFEILQQFEDAGVEVAWVDPSIPTKGPLSAIFTFLDAWRAGRERRAMVERTTRGRLEKARRGKVISRAAASYGYTYEPESSTLIINEEEAKVIRLIFHSYVQERLSLVKLADRLNRLGIVRPGSSRWRESGLGRLLRSETYAGTLWQNRWRQEKVSRKPGQKPNIKKSLRAKSEQIPVSVPAIIPRDVWDSAQRRLEENLKLAQRNTKREYLLSGLLMHSCGARMRGRTNHGRRYYHCKMTAASKAPINERGEPMVCQSKWVTGTDIEAAVWEKISGLLLNPVLLVKEIEKLSEPDSGTREAMSEELSHLKVRLENLPKEQKKLVEGYRKGYYPDFMMREETERVEKEKLDTEQRLSELQQQLERLERASGYKEEVEALAERLNQGLDIMGFEDRRELLRLLIDEIVYDDGGGMTIKTILPLGRLHPASREGKGERSKVGYPILAFKHERV
ncbi:MAG: recombinase family protein [Chloroflexi bacterium]|nr:recombinase family protein [Chloroflexota bacterium]